MRTPPLALIVAAGVAGALTLVDAMYPPWLTSYRPRETLDYSLVIAAVGAVYAGVGILAWRQRPASRIGPLMLAVGLAWLVFPLIWIPGEITWAIATLTDRLYLPLLAWLGLAFPSGRLRFGWERWVVIAAFAVWVWARLVDALFIDPRASCADCARNIFLIRADPNLADQLQRPGTYVQLPIAAAVIVLILLHWWLATRARRRTIAPLVWLLAPPVAFTAILFAGDLGRLSLPQVYPWLDVALLAPPGGYVIARIRDQLGRGRVGDLIVSLGAGSEPRELRDLLARTLHDPTLQVGYWLPDKQRYIDLDGNDVVLPSGDSSRAVTVLDRDGETLAAIVHDAAVADDPRLMAAATSAVTIAIENERLHAIVRAQLQDVRASRARIVAAEDAARRRLERDLHDGAQHRLVALSLALGMARHRLDTDTDRALVDSLDIAISEVRAALADLRDLARGIHPEILTRAGLVAAIRSLAERTPVPVQVTAEEDERLPASVEAAAYFVVCEAVANAVKHAGATQVTVRVLPLPGAVNVEIVDDGVGGADIRRGTGLRGLEDRVHALGGDFEVTRPLTGGTRVAAHIPCAL
jgi:signal transduction histidine kinase